MLIDRIQRGGDTQTSSPVLAALQELNVSFGEHQSACNQVWMRFSKMQSSGIQVDSGAAPQSGIGAGEKK
jgi:hypothetical protein